LTSASSGPEWAEVGLDGTGVERRLVPGGTRLAARVHRRSLTGAFGALKITLFAKTPAGFRRSRPVDRV
jgi:hypothetical protein